MIRMAYYNSPLGRILLAEKKDALVGLWFEGQKYFLEPLPKEEQIECENAVIFQQTKKWLDRYFAGKRPLISELNLAPVGSEFRQAVWKILCGIPYGEVMTYGDISKKIAASRGLQRMSAQAVGGAVAHNPISVIIPCHRVVGTNGSLTGYAGGIDRKIALLELERANMGKLFVPQKGTAL